MHELSIALGIVKIAEDERRKAKAKTVDSIDLEIGKLSGIELDSLEFAWPVAVKDTVLEHAVKNIESIDGWAKCLECEMEYPVFHAYDGCPACKSYFKDILRGKELRVKSLVVS